MIIDACSVILLAKATVLEEFAKWKSLIISKSVYSEVLAGKEKGFTDAMITQKLIEENKLKIESIKNKRLYKKLSEDFGLGEGEAESIALALGSKDNTIVTDNRQGRRAAGIYGLTLIGSMDVVVGMLKSKRIKKEKALEAIKSLKRFGWFDEYLIEQALEEVKNG